MDEFKNIIGEFKLSPEEIEAIRKPDYSFEYNETSIRIDAGKPRLDDRLGDGSRDEPTHPWEVIQTVEGDLTKLFVRSGRVIVDGDPVVTFEAPTFPGSSFALINPNTVIYLKFTRADGTGELLTVTVDSAAAIPVDTTTEEHWTIAEVTVEANSRGDVFVTGLTQRLFEDVRLEAADADTGPDHQWKVTHGTVTPAVVDPPVLQIPTLNVRGGYVITQPAFAEVWVPDAAPTLSAVTGQVMLRIERNTTTRAYVSALIEMVATASITADTDTYQWIPLADVVCDVDGAVTSIFQRKFDDIGIFEDLAFSNGEFVYAPLALCGRGTYPLA